MSIERIGFDVGGVIIGGQSHDGGKDTFFSDAYLSTPEMPGATAAIRRLLLVRFPAREAHIISKCGKNTQRKTVEWLEHSKLHAATLLPRENVHFCLERHEKAPIAERLGLTHFIDDRWTVLQHMKTVEHRILFAPNKSEIEAYHAAENRNGVHFVQSWNDVLALLLS